MRCAPNLVFFPPHFAHSSSASASLFPPPNPLFPGGREINTESLPSSGRRESGAGADPPPRRQPPRRGGPGLAPSAGDRGSQSRQPPAARLCRRVRGRLQRSVAIRLCRVRSCRAGAGAG